MENGKYSTRGLAKRLIQHEVKLVTHSAVDYVLSVAGHLAKSNFLEHLNCCDLYRSDCL